MKTVELRELEKCYDCGKELIGLYWRQPSKNISLCPDCISARIRKLPKSQRKQRIYTWEAWFVEEKST